MERLRPVSLCQVIVGRGRGKGQTYSGLVCIHYFLKESKIALVLSPVNYLFGALKWILLCVMFSGVVGGI